MIIQTYLKQFVKEFFFKILLCRLFCFSVNMFFIKLPYDQVIKRDFILIDINYSILSNINKKIITSETHIS